MNEFTHIVIGAGSAGCVLAARLSEDRANRVLLLEAGGADRHPFLRIPLATGKVLQSPRYSWGYATEPTSGLAGRSHPMPRGKVLGGSSSVNGMLYARGGPEDYDGWAALGNRGWSYAAVLPYFKRSEQHANRRSAYHGTQGPLAVCTSATVNPLYDAFIAAGHEAGYPLRDDFNARERIGFGRYDFNIDNGRRASTAVAYLHPARERHNLRVVTHAAVTRILLDAKRATGVEYLRRGRKRQVRAQAEVIVAAGAFNSPQLLMLSGIGDPAKLERAGIAARHALPGVGLNLQDHLQVRLRFGCTEPLTMHSLLRADRAALAMLRAWLFGSGPAATFPVEAGAFTTSRPSLAYPDLQWFFVIGLDVARLWFPGRALEPLEREGFSVSISLVRPESRGEVRLRSSDPLAAPIIAPAFLEAREDIDALLAGVAQARDVASRPSLARFVEAELAPGPGARDRDALEAWIRSAAYTGSHAAGTCKMGHDASAVVDDELRVRGLQGLRVADASVMPFIVSGNTNAPTIMIAEKAAELVMGRPPLPPENPQ